MVSLMHMTLRGHDTPPKQAFVVDDERAIARIIAYLLTELGWEVDIFGDAEAAYPMLRERRPGLIITDVQLPGLSGVDFTHCLRHDPATAKAVVVLVSAYAEPAGHTADAFMGKPFDIDEFLAFLGPLATEAEERLASRDAEG